ncbi:hypothetical protein D9M73_129100 [compost metagenome]
MRDAVVATNVLRAHDAADDQLAHLEIHAHFLPSADHQIAVGHHIGDDCRHRHVDGFRPRHRTGTIIAGGRFGIDQLRRIDLPGQDLGQRVLQPQQGADAAGFGAAAGAGRGVAQIRLVGDLDADRQDIALLRGALIMKEGTCPRAKERRIRRRGRGGGRTSLAAPIGRGRERWLKRRPIVRARRAQLWGLADAGQSAWYAAPGEGAGEEEQCESLLHGGSFGSGRRWKADRIDL